MADSFEYNNYTDGQDFSENMDTGAVNGDSKTTGEKINASKNDDDERKLFVGGLSWETTLKDIKDYFGKYGDIVDATLKTDPTTGRSRGFGFVLYSEATSVDKVIEYKSHTLHGRTIDPKRAKARGGREPILKVFVGGLDPVVPESEIREYFEKYGKVVEIDLPYDKAKGQRRAFCFVTFESEAIVDEVCKQAKQTIPGKQEKPVDVKKATPKNEQGGWGYGGGWGGGYGGGYGGGFGGGRGGGRGRGGRGRGRGGYNQGWSDYGGYGSDYYGGQNGYGSGYGSYDSYGGGGGYGNYDYNSYYGNQGGWGGYNGGGGYGGGYGGSNNYGGQQGGYGKAKSRGGGGSGYHPYSR